MKKLKYLPAWFIKTWLGRIVLVSILLAIGAILVEIWEQITVFHYFHLLTVILFSLTAVFMVGVGVYFWIVEMIKKNHRGL